MVFTRSQAAILEQEASPPMRQTKTEVRKQAPPKRKLFDQCGDDAKAAVAPANAEEACVEQSAAAPVEQAVPSAPPTPRTVDRERPTSETPVEAAPLLHPALEPALALAMQGWRTNLTALQPMVVVEDSVLLGAVAIMRAFAAARPDLSDVLHNSAPHLFTYAGAAMWLVAKACGMRTAIPNRALMSRACQIHPQALSDFELDLCISLSWDITKVLRAHDLLQ